MTPRSGRHVVLARPLGQGHACADDICPIPQPHDKAKKLEAVFIRDAGRLNAHCLWYPVPVRARSANIIGHSEISYGCLLGVEGAGQVRAGSYNSKLMKRSDAYVDLLEDAHSGCYRHLEQDKI